MRRLALILVAILALAISAQAQKVRVFGTAGQSQNVKGTPVFRTFPSCTITVFTTGTTTPVTIWTAADGLTIQANPFVASTAAVYGFFATAGVVVDIRFSGTGITTPFTISSVTVPGTGGGGGGGGNALTTNPLSQFAPTTSLQLYGTMTNPTGNGLLVFNNSPALITPTGIVKGDVGLGNVDNTSDSTKNAAVRTLTNAVISGASNTLSALPASGITGVIPIANLATGTPNGSKFIRDDGTLQAIPGGGDALTASPLSQFASTTSAQFFSVISNETGGTLVVGSASPTFTGTPLAPTAAVDTNTTQLATTAYVIGQGYAKLASPTFTGTPTLPTGTIATTQAALDSSTKVATTAFATTADNLKANLASPTFTGTPTLPTGTIATTQSAGNSTTAVATTSFVTTANNLKANLASPTFTGTPTLPSGSILTTPALTIRTQSNNVAIVSNSPYVNTSDGKLMVGNNAGAANGEIFVAGVSGPISNSNGGTGSTLGADTVLSTTSSVDLNTATATTLYTCPAGVTCVITKVVIIAASTSLTTASISFGWTSAAYADVIANASHTELTGATLYTILNAKTGAKLGAAADVFKVLANTLQGGAATVTIKVMGFVY